MSNLSRTVQHFPKMKVRGKRNRRREFWDRRLRFISEATIPPGDLVRGRRDFQSNAAHSRGTHRPRDGFPQVFQIRLTLRLDMFRWEGYSCVNS